MLGTFMTDINLGIYTANLDPGDASTPRASSCAFAIITTTTCCSADFMRELAARASAAAAARFRRSQNLASERVRAAAG